MRILVVHAHPEPNSFTAALASEARNTLLGDGHEVDVADLYAEAFNPVLGRSDFDVIADPDYFRVQNEQAHAEEQAAFAADIRIQQNRVAWADLLIFVFPLWWGAPPAIVKGWFERVMSYGFGYVDGARYDLGLFRGRSAMICLPVGGTAERFSDDGVYGSIERVLWPFKHCALRYMGYTLLEDFVAYAAPRVSQRRREIYLAEWKTHLRAQVGRAATTSAPQPVVRGGVGVQPLAFDPNVVIAPRA